MDKNDNTCPTCGAKLVVGGRGDFRDSDRACTQYYECPECGWPCEKEDAADE